jgi:hypothetical protein
MKPRTLFILGAILLAAATRFIPNKPPNFAPITGIALFGAATLPNRRLALLTPLAVLFLSDLVLQAGYNFGYMKQWGLYEGMWATYGTTLLITGLGLLLRRHRSPVSIAGTALASSCLFFVLTNFAQWAGGGLDPFGQPYPLTWEGLVRCYTNAIPFFQNTLLGDAVYVTVLFGGFALAQLWLPALRESSPPVSAAAVPEGAAQK